MQEAREALFDLVELREHELVELGGNQNSNKSRENKLHHGGKYTHTTQLRSAYLFPLGLGARDLFD